MNIGFTPIADFGLAPTAELLTRVFADYFVQIPFTETGLRQTERADSMDFRLSLIVRIDDQPAGVALIARRGTAIRVAGMGFLPGARRRGAGRVLMERLIGDARARGDGRLVLEVIEQNTPAVRLYETVGFRKIRRLVGFAGPAPAGLTPVPELVEADLRDVAAAISRQVKVDWPWQISGQTIAQLPPSARGYTLDGAWIVLLNPEGPTVGLRALAVEGGECREERAVRLLHAVMGRHPADLWRISALWPEEWSAWFTRAGLARQELTQWQMVREL